MKEEELRDELADSKKAIAKRKFTVEEEDTDSDLSEVGIKSEKIPRMGHHPKVNGSSSPVLSKNAKKEDDPKDQAVMNGDDKSGVASRLKENGRVQPVAESAVSTLQNYINGDIICQHGCLSPAEGKRRLVSKLVWNRLKAYFPGTKDFPRGAETCSKCREQQSEVGRTL